MVPQLCSKVTCQHCRLPTSLIELQVIIFCHFFLSVGNQLSRGSSCKKISLVHPWVMSLLNITEWLSFTFGNHKGKHNITALVTGGEYFNGQYDNLQNKKQEALVNTNYPRIPVAVPYYRPEISSLVIWSPFCPLCAEKNELRGNRLIRKLIVLKH